MCAGSEVVLVGGGNSAGQAAVFLAAHASTVHMLVRRADLAATMSRYLIDRIEATPNIVRHFNTELTGLHGETGGRLEAVSWRDNRAANEERHSIHHVFLFVGADPETDWLRSCGVGCDDNGFVLTGRACAVVKPESVGVARVERAGCLRRRRRARRVREARGWRDRRRRRRCRADSPISQRSLGDLHA
jgi:thioredoxin reductase